MDQRKKYYEEKWQNKNYQKKNHNISDYFHHRNSVISDFLNKNTRNFSIFKENKTFTLTTEKSSVGANSASLSEPLMFCFLLANIYLLWTSGLNPCGGKGFKLYTHLLLRISFRPRLSLAWAVMVPMIPAIFSKYFCLYLSKYFSLVQAP